VVATSEGVLTWLITLTLAFLGGAALSFYRRRLPPPDRSDGLPHWEDIKPPPGKRMSSMSFSDRMLHGQRISMERMQTEPWGRVLPWVFLVAGIGTGLAYLVLR
jgi:hypothetical protein